MKRSFTAVLFLAEVAAILPGTALLAQVPQIGGEDVITLHRVRTGHGDKPEFLSVVLLPGRGMNVFQITADIPGQGETKLIQSPPLAEAAALLNDEIKDPYGYASYSMGGDFLLPWASRLTGAVSSDGSMLALDWQGHPLEERVNLSGKYAIHGLMHKSQVRDVKVVTTRDGQTLTGTLHAGDFGGRWISSTDVKFQIVLSGDAVEASVTAVNVGPVAEPMAIGWHPYFAIPSHDRSQVKLHLAAERYAVTAPPDNLTTGELRPVNGTAMDFRAPAGAHLGDAINVNFSGLGGGSACPAALIDAKSSYGICVRPLSSAIHTMQVYSPKDSSFIAIEPQLNFPDPLGSEWKGMNTGMVTLKPGQSVAWRVRLELFKP